MNIGFCDPAKLLTQLVMRRWVLALSILSLLTAIPVRAQVLGTFCTGADNGGNVLPTYSVDPHFTLVASADPSFQGPDAVVVDDTLFPIATGNWIASSSVSKWIGPQGDQDYLADPSYGDSPGDYTYRITFDLTGYVPDLIQVTGRWTCDSQGEVRLNGASTGNSVSTNSPYVPAVWHPLVVTSGFLPGTNTLDFVVTRVAWGGSPDLPTGVRAELVLTNSPPPPLQIGSSGKIVMVWWPTNVSSFVLETSTRLGPNQSWNRYVGAITTIGDQNLVVEDATLGAKFFRLRRP